MTHFSTVLTCIMKNLDFTRCNSLCIMVMMVGALLYLNIPNQIKAEGGGETMSNTPKKEDEQTSEPVTGISWYNCQAGYLPGSIKRVVFSSASKMSNDEFRIVNDKEAVVHKGKVDAFGTHPWGGTFYSADFSNVKAEGTYRIVLAGSSSPEFTIAQTAYSEVLDLASRWFYYQRCGCKIPGWHEACHTDDGVVRSKEQDNYGAMLRRFDATGGWHDAGDYNKWTQYSWIGIFGLLETIPAVPELKQRILEEARWEVEYVLKVQTPEGRYLNVVGWHPEKKPDGTWSNNPWNFWGAPENETDNKQGTDDDRLIEEEKSLTDNPARLGFALARYAEHLPEDEPLRKRCNDAALKSRECILEHSEIEKRTISERAALALLDLSLHNLTDKKEYFNEAREEVKRILELQHDDGWFRNRPADNTPAVDYHFGFLYVMALLDFAERFPESDVAETIKEAVERFLDFELNHIAGGPFQHRREYTLDENPNELPHIWQGYNCYFCTGAYVAARAYRLWKNSAWLDYAERQVQWVLGRNPLGVCMVVDAGTRHPGVYHHRYGSIPGHTDARVPGGVVNGINGEKNDGMQTGMPVLDQGESGVTGQWQTNEYWVPNQGWFLCALSEVAQARQDD